MVSSIPITQQQPFVIYGKVNRNSSFLANEAVTIRNDTKAEEYTTYTNTVGEYGVDLADTTKFPSGYSDGDLILVTSINITRSTTVDVSLPGREVNIYAQIRSEISLVIDVTVKKIEKLYVETIVSIDLTILKETRIVRYESSKIIDTTIRSIQRTLIDRSIAFDVIQKQLRKQILDSSRGKDLSIVFLPGKFFIEPIYSIDTTKRNIIRSILETIHTPDVIEKSISREFEDYTSIVATLSCKMIRLIVESVNLYDSLKIPWARTYTISEVVISSDYAVKKVTIFLEDVTKTIDYYEKTLGPLYRTFSESIISQACWQHFMLRNILESSIISDLIVDLKIVVLKKILYETTQTIEKVSKFSIRGLFDSSISIDVYERASMIWERTYSELLRSIDRIIQLIRKSLLDFSSPVDEIIPVKLVEIPKIPIRIELSSISKLKINLKDIYELKIKLGELID